MSAPVLLNTSRGSYRLTPAEQTAADDGSLTLTLSAEHTGGLEKFAFRCAVAGSLRKRAAIADGADAGARLARWLEGQFEQVREAALKTIRSERRLAEIQFDDSNPGPF
jgi:hypothetical protein